MHIHQSYEQRRCYRSTTRPSPLAYGCWRCGHLTIAPFPKENTSCSAGSNGLRILSDLIPPLPLSIFVKNHNLSTAKYYIWIPMCSWDNLEKKKYFLEIFEIFWSLFRTKCWKCVKNQQFGSILTNIGAGKNLRQLGIVDFHSTSIANNFRSIW